jgi:hypothetical protein
MGAHLARVILFLSLELFKAMDAEAWVKSFSYLTH